MNWRIELSVGDEGENIIPFVQLKNSSTQHHYTDGLRALRHNSSTSQ